MLLEKAAVNALQALSTWNQMPIKLQNIAECCRILQCFRFSLTLLHHIERTCCQRKQLWMLCKHLAHGIRCQLNCRILQNIAEYCRILQNIAVLSFLTYIIASHWKNVLPEKAAVNALQALSTWNQMPIELQNIAEYCSAFVSHLHYCITLKNTRF